MRFRFPFLQLVPALCLALVGCSDDAPSDTSAGAPGGVRKMESFCNLQGTQPPKRETLLVIDRASINSSSPEEFRAKNPRLIEVLTGLADTGRALDTSAMAPRERLSILSVDLKSGAVTPVFSGCLPGLSPEEQAARSSSGSDTAFDKYMGSDISSKVKEEGENFLKFALISTLSIKSSPPSRHDQPGASLTRLIKLLAKRPGGMARRLFIYTDASRDLRGASENFEEARKQAFQQSRNGQVNMGLVDVHLIPAGRDLSAVQLGFLDALFLGAGGDLRSATPFSPDKLSAPAQKTYFYSGQMALTEDVSVPVELRLNTARDGSLVSSWISYTGSAGVWATPISGQFSCLDEGSCDLRSDPQAGFGQRWRTLPGTDPQPLADAPFGGMRIIEGTVQGDTISVRIHDPIIKVITDNSGSTDIKFTAKTAE